MTPEEAAVATAAGISTITSHFMLDPSTYAAGASAGFSGLDFYVTGRGGVLGPVDADEVARAFVWLEPSMVRQQWEAGCAVAPPHEAAALFAGVLHAWAEGHVPDHVDAPRLADLAARAVAGADAAGAPLFDGWRRLPEPTSPRARALHHLNALRELRGARHAQAVQAEGLHPLEALLVRTPYMAAMFGWPEPHPDVAGLNQRWEEAEAATDRAMAEVFAPLPEDERDELVGLIVELHRVTSG
jgi:hypothetical protein